MKTLYIIRHAKSSWDDPQLDDHARPLNARGERDAPRMAKRLKEKRVALDLVLTSTAQRTLSTSLHMVKILGIPESSIKADNELYHASSSTLLRLVQSLSDKYDTVMLVGHNPGLTDFVNELVDESINNIPTCGIVACKISVESWRKVAWGKGELLFFDYPKNQSSQ